MAVREPPAQPAPPHKSGGLYTAEKARGDEIILRSRRRRIIFIGRRRHLGLPAYSDRADALSASNVFRLMTNLLAFDRSCGTRRP
jgi:hypothetical protein